MIRFTRISTSLKSLASLAVGCVLYTFTGAPEALAANNVSGFTVVLDAGHGGRDFGCQGRKASEKEITLDVVKRTAAILEKSKDDSINVVLTRNTHTSVAFDKRAAIANNASADLFISVHVNSIDKRSKGREKVHGASVYTVGLHKSDANMAVAMRENSVIELEEDFTEVYQGFDPNSSESYIIFELTQNRHMANSIELASLVQDGLIKHAGRADKGVRQAGFLVLWATKMPSILIELDFICNPAAENFLASDAGKQKCAEAIASAVKSYKKAHPGIMQSN